MQVLALTDKKKLACADLSLKLMLIPILIISKLKNSSTLFIKI